MRYPLWLFRAFLVAVPFFLSPLFAATLYVDGVNGKDSNNGLSVSTAFQTLQKAADTTNAGDTVQVMNGTYTNSWTGVPVVLITRSGTAAAWITYKAYPGHKPLLKFTDAWQGFAIQANYIIVDGFEIQGGAAGITLAYAQSQQNNGNDPTTGGTGIFFGTTNGTSPVQHHVIIRNNNIHHCPGGGIGTGYADYVTIQNNTAYDNAWWSPYGASGISIWESQDSDANTGYKNFVTGNITYGNEEFIPVLGSGGQITDGNGIIIDRSQDKSFAGRTYVANNITYNNGGSGIHAFASAHVDIVNNTAYMNNHSPSPWTNNGQIFSNSGTDVYILNNILYAPANRLLNSNWNNTNVTTDYNIDFGGSSITVQGTHDVVADPKFVNAASSNFHLLAGSPAIGNGTNTKAPTTDIAGAARVSTSIDRGAYVFSTAPVLTTISVAPATAVVGPGAKQQFTATGLDQNGAALATQPSWTWSVSGGGSINATGLFSAGTTGGTFTVTARNGSISGVAHITVDLAPTVVSPPSVSPTTIVINVPVTFSGSGSDPAGGTINYQWNFGDGATGTGSPVNHTFTNAGNFTVTFTMTNSVGGTTTLTLNITVINAGGNNGGGGGGGGGSGNGNGGGSAGGGSGTAPIAMTVSKLQGVVKFSSSGHDGCSISGTIPNLPKLFDTTGQSLALNIGGAAVTFTLDGKGRGKANHGSIALKLKPSKRNPATKKIEFQGGNVAFAARLQNGSWATAWGLDPMTSATNVSMDLPATIVLGGNTYVVTVTATYSDKAGVGGKFKKH